MKTLLYLVEWIAAVLLWPLEIIGMGVGALLGLRDFGRYLRFSRM